MPNFRISTKYTDDSDSIKFDHDFADTIAGAEKIATSQSEYQNTISVQIWGNAASRTLVKTVNGIWAA